MNKKRKILIAVLAPICLALLFFAGKYIMDAPFRDQLPAYPDFKAISASIGEQISSAGRKACLFTTADNLGELGRVYHSCANYEKAAKCYQLAVKKDSKKWIWSYYLGYLNLEQGELRTAIENFNNVIANDPKNYLALYYAGEAYQKLGSTDSAEILFKKIAAAPDADVDKNKIDREKYFPLKTYANFQLARIYMNSNRVDSAEITLKAIIDSQMTFGPAYRLLGNVYTVKNNLPLADKYSVRANDLADFTPPADWLADRITMMSRSDQYLLKQIEDALRDGNYRWALKVNEQAIKYYPNDKYLVSNEVYENFRQGQDEKALSYLDRHFNYYKDDAKELMDITDLLYNKGHGEEAIKYLNQVKKLLPENSSLAVWLYDRGKKKEAIIMMNELLKAYPKNTKILGDVIRLLVNMGDDELAKKYFADLTKLSPAGLESLKITGLMAEKQGDPESAFTAYEEASKLDPKDLLFNKELIDLYIGQKNWQMAISHFRQLLDIYPNEPALLEGLGRLLISCPDSNFKNLQEGIEYSERAFINNKSPYKTQLSAGKNLATAYVFLGDKKNAVKFINLTIELAKQGNESQEYITYFTALVAKK